MADGTTPVSSSTFLLLNSMHIECLLKEERLILIYNLTCSDFRLHDIAFFVVGYVYLGYDLS